MSERRSEPHTRVVIVGGGFGGLSAAKALAKQPFDVTLIDRHNYHLFQPLLYQVATAGLSPADIASPIRGILARASRTPRCMLARCRASITRARGGHRRRPPRALRLSRRRDRRAARLFRPRRLGARSRPA